MRSARARAGCTILGSGCRPVIPGPTGSPPRGPTIASGARRWRCAPTARARAGAISSAQGSPAARRAALPAAVSGADDAARRQWHHPHRAGDDGLLRSARARHRHRHRGPVLDARLEPLLIRGQLAAELHRPQRLLLHGLLLEVGVPCHRQFLPRELAQPRPARGRRADLRAGRPNLRWHRHRHCGRRDERRSRAGAAIRLHRRRHCRRLRGCRGSHRKLRGISAMARRSWSPGVRLPGASLQHRRPRRGGLRLGCRLGRQVRPGCPLGCGWVLRRTDDERLRLHRQARRHRRSVASPPWPAAASSAMAP